MAKVMARAEQKSKKELLVKGTSHEQQWVQGQGSTRPEGLCGGTLVLFSCVGRQGIRASLSSMGLMCESLVHCPCPLPASPLPWVGPPLGGLPALVRHLGLRRSPRGLFTAPASVSVVSDAGQVAASSMVPVGYNRLWVQLACYLLSPGALLLRHQD